MTDRTEQQLGHYRLLRLLGRLIHSHRGHSDLVNSLAWSPDSTRIASVSKDAMVQVWDTEFSQHPPAQRSPRGVGILTFRAHSSSTHAVTWLPDGKHIAVACGDGTVQVWSAS